VAPALERQLIVATEFATTAAEHIVAARPHSLALSGGSTPWSVLEHLAESDLPWPEIEVFFSDERCVPPDHPDSNYGMAWRALLSKVPARVHRMPGETCDADAYEHDLSEVFGPGLPCFDLVLLGLGADGHTASLFPGDPALAVRDRLVVRIERPDHSRLTLTLPVLSAARQALFLVSGRDKREALDRLLDGEDIPAARVEAEKVVVIADRAAAGDA
jgi:6-phosphogluconolactonase